VIRNGKAVGETSFEIPFLARTIAVAVVVVPHIAIFQALQNQSRLHYFIVSL
jgi:hypothetical protein